MQKIPPLDTSFASPSKHEKWNLSSKCIQLFPSFHLLSLVDRMDMSLSLSGQLQKILRKGQYTKGCFQYPSQFLPCGNGMRIGNHFSQVLKGAVGASLCQNEADVKIHMEIDHHISSTDQAGKILACSVSEIWESMTIWHFISASFWNMVTTTAPFKDWLLQTSTSYKRLSYHDKM